MSNTQIHLDPIEILVVKSLLKDGRKSFCQISRETGISTPTVKARFDKLVNIGFIKFVSPVLDFSKAKGGNARIRLVHMSLKGFANLRRIIAP
ncbi:MAG: winged helix-turn-helix transcriptional regulator [Nitrososphaeraceae archaeon]